MPVGSIDSRNLNWRKSLRSIANGECVEVAAAAQQQVAVRDSTNPDGARLAYPAQSWRAFVARVKS